MLAGTSSYRRPLPDSLIAFSAPEGRVLLQEALQAGGMESFFPLIEQFHTQADPAFCGLGSLVMALNALGVDPGRTWRGPWRWFSEELLDCCTPLEQVQKAGVSLEELACLARCNGAEAVLSRPDEAGSAGLRAAVNAATRAADRVLVVSYSRAALGQTGAGHYSPVGGYHAARDLVLILDVARFKYPPHWVSLSALFAATQDADPVTQRSRGWLSLAKRGPASAVAQFLSCQQGMLLKGTLQQLLVALLEAVRTCAPSTLEAMLELTAAAIQRSGLCEQLQFRPPRDAEQASTLELLRGSLHALPLYTRAAASLGAAPAVPVVLWLLATPTHCWSVLPASLRSLVLQLCDPGVMQARIAAEVQMLRSQLEFLLEHARPGCGSNELGLQESCRSA
jgi:phytochelatin synthase